MRLKKRKNLPIPWDMVLLNKYSKWLFISIQFLIGSSYLLGQDIRNLECIEFVDGRKNCVTYFKNMEDEWSSDTITILYKYNLKGQVNEEIRFGAKVSLNKLQDSLDVYHLGFEIISVDKHFYKKGRRIKTETRSVTPLNELFITKYKYNKLNGKVAQENVSRFNKPIWKVKYIYDETGMNLIRRDKWNYYREDKRWLCAVSYQYFPNGDYIESKYKYDNNKNLVEVIQKKFTKEGVLIFEKKKN
jgi:hypothetical protein